MHFCQIYYSLLLKVLITWWSTNNLASIGNIKCYRVNKWSQTSRSVFQCISAVLWLFAVAPVCGTYGYNDHNPPCRSHSPPMWLDPSHPLIMSLPSSNTQWVTPHHMHMAESQSDSLAWPMVTLSRSGAWHNYSSRSVFLLTALLCNAKLCDPNVLKVIPIQVSNIQSYSCEEASQKGKG